MNDTQMLTFSGDAIERRIAEQVADRILIAAGGPDALREMLHPIVRDLIAEELPQALRKAMPDFLREFDRALATSISRTK